MRQPTGKELRDAVKYWQTALGLEGWSYTVRIGRLPGGDYGSAEVDVPYKKVHFRFWPKGIAEARETVDALAVHEWSHVLTEALAAHCLRLAKTPRNREITEELEEALTTEIERLVLRLHARPRSQ